MDMRFRLRYTDYNMKSEILKIFVVALAVVTPVQAYGRATNDPAAAAMYNEMGVKAFKDGATAAAVSYFEQARRLNPSDKTIKKNLAAAYTGQGMAEYDKRDLADAQKYFEAALQLDPENVDSLVLLGDIKYLSQKMDEAKALWEKVLKVYPDYRYRKEIEEKIAKLAKEAKVEKDYRSTGMDRFEIKYSREGARLSYNVRYYLQEAYRLLGQDFDYRPGYRITVLISDREQFETIGGWPAGTQGGYDGKIRLPLIGADYTPDHIRGLVWHEYTHLIVEDLSKGRAPLWMNEGLAYYEGFKYMKKRMATLKAAVDKNRLIPLAGLDDVLKAQDVGEEYWLACEESYTIASYMMKRYNKYTIREILKGMGGGETFETVMKKKFNTSMKEFEKRWLTELNKGRLY